MGKSLKNIDDAYKWSLETVAALRAGDFSRIDMDELINEIGSIASGLRREMSAILKDILEALSIPQIAPTREALRTFTAKDIDPGWQQWVLLLALADFAVFYDYAHARLTPWLEVGFLQGMGLGIYAMAVVWIGITGRFLALNYQRTRQAGAVMMDGPYAAIRHPLYSALIASRAGFALLFASVLGWLLAALWIYRIAVRIRREEAWLRQQFGELYEAYARRTPALVHASIASLFRR